MLTLDGLTAADEVVVPLPCETLAHRGVGQFLRTINDVQQITNADLQLLGALPTLYDSRTTHSARRLLVVADRYDCRCCRRRSRAPCGSRGDRRVVGADRP